MGMGEPLLNYENLLKSIELVSSKNGLSMSPKRITVSTAGIAKMIKKGGYLITERFDSIYKNQYPCLSEFNNIAPGIWQKI